MSLNLNLIQIPTKWRGETFSDLHQKHFIKSDVHSKLNDSDGKLID
jgi:hypothetical protein